VRELYTAAAGGRLHHAWLIGGRPGIGKATLAYRFARWLLAGATSADLSVDPGHPVFKRVAAGTHVDLKTIERRFNEKTKKMQTIIAVDTVREIKQFFHLTAGEGGWRIVVVEGAEDFTPEAQNALLKGLEEPPKQAILLLATDAPSRLLPTTRSRCRVLNLAPLKDEQVAALMARYAPDISGEAKRKIVELAEGSIGTALSLGQETGMAMAGLVDEVLAGPAAPARAQAIADGIARAEDGFALFMSLLRAGLAARTRAAARRGADNLAGQVTVWQELGRIEREAEHLYLDKRAAIVVALSLLHGR
jgi:DNA polymerase-3 subunit delta'